MDKNASVSQTNHSSMLSGFCCAIGYFFNQLTLLLTFILLYLRPPPRTYLMILEGEKETSVSCLLQAAQPRTEPVSEACALIRHRTHNLVHRTTLQPTEPPQPGPPFILKRRILLSA